MPAMLPRFSGTTSSSSTRKPKVSSNQVTRVSTPIESMTPASSRSMSRPGAVSSPGKVVTMKSRMMSCVEAMRMSGMWGREGVRGTPAAGGAAGGLEQIAAMDGTAGATSARAAPEQHHFDRLQQDHEVEHQAVVLDVEQVELQLFPGVVDRGAVGIAQLGPAGQSRLHRVAHVVVADLAVELVDELRPLRARADEAHVTGQHVEQLRQLVQPGHADEAANARGAIVVAAGPARHAVLLRVGAHAAELHQVE